MHIHNAFAIKENSVYTVPVIIYLIKENLLFLSLTVQRLLDLPRKLPAPKGFPDWAPEILAVGRLGLARRHLLLTAGPPALREDGQAAEKRGPEPRPAGAPASGKRASGKPGLGAHAERTAGPVPVPAAAPEEQPGLRPLGAAGSGAASRGGPASSPLRWPARPGQQPTPRGLIAGLTLSLPRTQMTGSECPKGHYLE